MVFTLNEELHLPACLASVRWSDDVIVIDSFSTDGTSYICKASGVRLFCNRFEGFGTQRNWALENCAPKHEWVLILDADERVTAELAEELKQVACGGAGGVSAYRVRRRFYMWGRWLRYSSLYPTWVVRLVRQGRVRYVNRGHAETQEIDGLIGDLKHDLIDENRKGVSEWFERQNRYSSKEAEYELAGEVGRIRIGDLLSSDPLIRRAALKRIAARLPGRPLFYFLYSYVIRRGFLDGRDGLTFCLMKTIYQAMIVVKKHDLRRRRRENEASREIADLRENGSD